MHRTIAAGTFSRRQPPKKKTTPEVTASMGPIRSPSGESARHEDAQKRLISATAAAQKRRVRGLAYESPAALRGWRSGEQAGTCSAVLGAAGESRERGRGWPPRAAKAKYRTIFSTGEATRRSNGPGQPREAAPRKSRKPRNAERTARCSFSSSSPRPVGGRQPRIPNQIHQQLKPTKPTGK